MSQIFTAIGLMSGTSLDGVDAALLKSDGRNVAETGESLTLEYPDGFRARLYRLVSGEAMAAPEIAAIERKLTLFHAKAVRQLLEVANVSADGVDLIGFHGQTIAHAPAAGYTLQIGDGALLAKETGIDVVCDFRSKDVAEGGQGAPLVPLYHSALIAAHSDVSELPVAIVNIGGVANVTYVGKCEAELLAFDTGPGNALLNDWVQEYYGKAYDENGEIARGGAVNNEVLEQYLSHDYFAKVAPKSLDRQDFTNDSVSQLSPEDGAATLTELTAASIVNAQEQFPRQVNSYYICGGGRHNSYLMERIASQLGGGHSVRPIEALGYDGDALEAQAFAYLAIRSRLGLPLSLPQTTGAGRAVLGGAFYPV